MDKYVLNEFPEGFKFHQSMFSNTAQLDRIETKLDALNGAIMDLIQALSESEVSDRIAAENTLDGINLEEELTSENTYGTLG